MSVQFIEIRPAQAQRARDAYRPDESLILIEASPEERASTEFLRRLESARERRFSARSQMEFAASSI